MKIIWEGQNFKFPRTRGYGYPKWPPFGQKMAFLGPKKISYIFSESSFQNLMFDTKTNLLSFVDAKIWSFKNWRCAKNAKIWNAHNTPPRGPRAKKFWISKFLHRGYLHTKNDQNRWDKGVKLFTSVLERAFVLIQILFHLNPNFGETKTLG